MITDIKASTGAANDEGEFTCTLKFKLGRDDLDLWFWFCKSHADCYRLEVDEDGLRLVESLRPLAEGQTTLDEVDDEEADT